MPEDRDKRSPLTPPAGVAAQLAPRREARERTDATPVHGVPVTESPVETLVRRAGQTKQIVMGIDVEVIELKGRVEGLETRVEDIHRAVDVQGKQNDTIIRMTGDVISVLKNQSTTTTTIAIAETEIKTKRAMTENELAREHGLALIEDKKQTRATRREWGRKIFDRFALPLLVAVAAFLVATLTRCGQ